MRFISQLISGRSTVLQKLPRHFNETAISTFTISSLSVFYINLNLNLNNLESVMLSPGSCLQYCHKLPNVCE